MIDFWDEGILTKQCVSLDLGKWTLKNFSTTLGRDTNGKAKGATCLLCLDGW